MVWLGMGNQGTLVTAGDLAAAMATAMAAANRSVSDGPAYLDVPALHIAGMRVDLRCEVVNMTLALQTPQDSLLRVGKRRSLAVLVGDRCDVSITARADGQGGSVVERIDLVPVAGPLSAPMQRLTNWWRRLWRIIGVGRRTDGSGDRDNGT